jgi:hypothetical protein
MEMVEAVKAAALRADAEATQAAFNKLRAKAPDVATYSEAVFRSLVSIGMFDLAELVAAEGLRRYPGAAEFMIRHGEIARYRGDWPEMVRRFEYMRRECPRDVWGFVLGGVALRELERYRSDHRARIGGRPARTYLHTPDRTTQEEWFTTQVHIEGRCRPG